MVGLCTHFKNINTATMFPNYITSKRPIIFLDQKSIYVQKGEASLVHFGRREQMVRQSHLTDLFVFFKSGNSI